MSKRDLSESMGTLKAQHPDLFVGTDDDWKRRVDAYWSRLRRFDPDVVETACQDASAKAGKFSSAPQVERAARAIQGRRDDVARENDRKDQSEAAAISEAERVRYHRAHVIPDDPEEQDVWVDEVENELFRLARRWEVESKRLNLDPNKPCPPAVAKRRMSEFWAAFGEESRPTPTTGAQPRESATEQSG